MSAKAIYESDGKTLLAKFLTFPNFVKNKYAMITSETKWDELVEQNPWLATEVIHVLLCFVKPVEHSIKTVVRHVSCRPRSSDLLQADNY